MRGLSLVLLCILVGACSKNEPTSPAALELGQQRQLRGVKVKEDAAGSNTSLPKPTKGWEAAKRPGESKRDSRTALVIGNADYKSVGRLRNPVNDARDMARVLRQLDFEVTLLTDTKDKRAMETGIKEFADQLKRDKGVGLFFYAGHGVQLEGKNFMLPIEVSTDVSTDLKYDGVEVDLVLQEMGDAGNGMNLIILDACRNNPFPAKDRAVEQGLAHMNAPSGTLISYATAPGDVAEDGSGRNGLFTSKLLTHITQPGLKIEDVFKNVRSDVIEESGNEQTPWESSSLIGDFFFVPVVKSSVVNSRSDSKQQALEAWELPLKSLEELLSQGAQLQARSMLQNYQQGQKFDQLVKYFTKQPASLQYELGRVFWSATELSRHQELAFFWYQKAAERKHPSAQTMMGYMHQTGKGTSENIALAAQWYEKAANQGEGMAMFNLASLYRKGSGVDQNFGRAKALYEQAARQGNQQAADALKRMQN